MKLMHLLTEYKNNFDCLFLHWNPYKHIQNADDWDCNYKHVTAEEWSVDKSCQWNMGSGAGYVLSRQGAKMLLDSINKNGMPNAVDWVIMKQPQMRIMYSKPKLVFVDCWQNNQQVSSDIQLEYDTVQYKNDEEWLAKDVKVWQKHSTAQIKQVDQLPSSYSVARKNIWILPYSSELVVPSDWLCKWYIVGKKYIVIVPDMFLTTELYKQFVWKQNRLNFNNV
jgi:hypothetical protein